jgi:hypothetical protein
MELLNLLGELRAAGLIVALSAPVCWAEYMAKLPSQRGTGRVATTGR